VQKEKGIARSRRMGAPRVSPADSRESLRADDEPLTIDENARFSVSASSSYQFKSNLDGGGDVSIARYGIWGWRRYAP